MDFSSDRQYVEVCLDYALAYSERELSAAFDRVVTRVAYRPENIRFLNSAPVYVDMTHGDLLQTPTDIAGGLRFFIQPLTRAWPAATFSAYFSKVKADMIQCYVPFRSFSAESFQDAMRLRVYQDAMNIIAGRSLDGMTKRKYSPLRKALAGLSSSERPAL